jgi:hypothetical protein
LAHQNVMRDRPFYDAFRNAVTVAAQPLVILLILFAALRQSVMAEGKTARAGLSAATAEAPSGGKTRCL